MSLLQLITSLQFNRVSTYPTVPGFVHFRCGIVPVPGRQAFEPEAAPMVEAFLIARRLRWSDTVDDDCLEARVAIGIGGVVKELLTAS
jgi:hypothetical protein